MAKVKDIRLLKQKRYGLLPIEYLRKIGRTKDMDEDPKKWPAYSEYVIVTYKTWQAVYERVFGAEAKDFDGMEEVMKKLKIKKSYVIIHAHPLGRFPGQLIVPRNWVVRIK